MLREPTKGTNVSHIADDSAQHAGQDQDWADRLSPDRRRLLTGRLVTMGALASASWSGEAMAKTATIADSATQPTLPIET